MVKHFEELWVASEQLAYLQDKTILISNLQQLLQQFENSQDKQQLLGQILFNITGLTRQYDLNAWTALLSQTQIQQVEILENG